MLNDFVVPGDRIEMVELLKEGQLGTEGYKKRKYKSRVLALLTESLMEVEVPLESASGNFLEDGSEYDLSFYTEKGMYQCYGRARDRYLHNRKYVQAVELLSSLKKYQKREYYRFNCVINMKCRRISSDKDEGFSRVEFLNNDFLLQDGTIVDISGGGARFVSRYMYQINTDIIFRFSLDIGKTSRDYSLRGRVVASRKIGNSQYENRIYFVNINNRDRESIIKYIFEEERKQRREGRNA